MIAARVSAWTPPAQNRLSSVTLSVPHHRFSIKGRHGPLTLDITATLAAPWTVVFGPSGSGKSTLLRALAGLLPHPQTTFDRRDPSTGVWKSLGSVPTQHRALAYDPQGAPLLPHLTVSDNIRFPELLRRIPAAASQVPALLDLLRLKGLAGQHPARLSGGERQRVSLARALAVPDARLLLLDEPFAGLDRTLRDDLLPALRASLKARALPVLSVTHDPDEALLLNADVLRIRDGKLTAHAPAPVALADEVARLQQLLDTPS